MALNIEFNITEAYKDGLQPAMKQIGGVLEDLTKTARLLTAPLSLCGVGSDRFQVWCDKLRNGVKEENMTAAQPNILIPTLCGLSINPDETLLGEMFFNILQSSVDKTKQKFLSPAFPKILEQISSEEARLLTYLKYNQHIEFIYFMENNEHGVYAENMIEIFCDIDKDLFSINKHHLTLLGLVTFGYSKQAEAFFKDGDRLIAYESQEGKKILVENKFSNYKSITKYYAKLTLNDFGKAFVDICISEKCREFLASSPS